MQVGNTIGKGNRFQFLAFLLIEEFAMAAGCLVAIVRLHQTHAGPEWDTVQEVPWVLAFIVGDIFMLLGVTALAATQVRKTLH